MSVYFLNGLVVVFPFKARNFYFFLVPYHLRGTFLKLKFQVAGFDSPYLLEMNEQNIVCRANRGLLVKCHDNKKVKTPYNWVTSFLTQPQVANQQKKLYFT